MARKIIIRKGNRFGNLKVVDSPNGYDKYWRCRCDCGQLVTRTVGELLSGTRNQCKKCYKPTLVNESPCDHCKNAISKKVIDQRTGKPLLDEESGEPILKKYCELGLPIRGKKEPCTEYVGKTGLYSMCIKCHRLMTKRIDTMSAYCGECQAEGRAEDEAILENLDDNGVGNLIGGIFATVRSDILTPKSVERAKEDAVSFMFSNWARELAQCDFDPEKLISMMIEADRREKEQAEEERLKAR